MGVFLELGDWSPAHPASHSAWIHAGFAVKLVSPTIEQVSYAAGNELRFLLEYGRDATSPCSWLEDMYGTMLIVGTAT